MKYGLNIVGLQYLRKLSIFILVVTSIACSQEKQNPLKGMLISTKMEIKSDTRWEDENGIIINGDADIKIAANATLTIASQVTVVSDKAIFSGKGKVVFETAAVEHINIDWFGATANDGTADNTAIQKAIDVAVGSPGVSKVYIPAGEYHLEEPLVAMLSKNDGYTFFNLTVEGHQLPYNNTGKGKGGVSVLKATKELPFLLGIQGARGVHIDKLVFDGFLNKEFSKKDLIYKNSQDLYKQERFTPISAIVIDPFSDGLPDDKGYSGLSDYYQTNISSSRVKIENCVLQNVPTGIAISPNGKTNQGDTIAISFTRFHNMVQGVVICQAQSRNVVVDNCSFHRMKYAFNSEDYGEQQGVLPEVSRSKIADGVVWLYKANGNIAYGHFNQVYAEGLYGIGYSQLNKQPMHFDACVFKFRPLLKDEKEGVNPILIKADNASFVGCTFTFGGGKKNVEPLLMDIKDAVFINCYFDSTPINIGENIRTKNKSEFLSKGLRKAKLKTSTWDEANWSETENVGIEYDSNMERFSINDTGVYEVGDYIFGALKMESEPFNGERIFTAIGQVVSKKGGKIFFENAYLPKNAHKLLIIRSKR
ncbi:glycoside hydrolase family 55 protein [Flavobacteriaceae bacterium TK19130]|nr:glycoside hydrolase family 55 protein [Thermobacterium salinum]